MTPPVVTITAGPPASTTDTTATFAFAADDPAALFQCSLDGGPLVFCESGVSYTGLLAGEHTLEVTATKPNLLVEGEPAVWTWTVDDDDRSRNGPITAVRPSRPTAIGSVSERPVFTFGSNEPGGFDCALDRVSSETGGRAFAAPPLFHHVTDLPGRRAHPAPSGRSTRAGTSTDHRSPSPGPSSARRRRDHRGTRRPRPRRHGRHLHLHRRSAERHVRLLLDGDTVRRRAALPSTYTGLGGGEHTLRRPGHELASASLEEPPATSTWNVIDATPPLTTIVSGPAATMTTGIANFVFSSNELNVELRVLARRRPDVRVLWSRARGHWPRGW